MKNYFNFIVKNLSLIGSIVKAKKESYRTGCIRKRHVISKKEKARRERVHNLSRRS